MYDDVCNCVDCKEFDNEGRPFDSRLPAYAKHMPLRNWNASVVSFCVHAHQCFCWGARVRVRTCVYACACLSVYLCVNVCVSMTLHVCAYLYVAVCMCVCSWVSVCMCAFVHVRVCVCACVRACVRVCVCVCLSCAHNLPCYINTILTFLKSLWNIYLFTGVSPVFAFINNNSILFPIYS